MDYSDYRDYSESANAHLHEAEEYMQEDPINTAIADSHSLISIAISLDRIADKLEEMHRWKAGY